MTREEIQAALESGDIQPQKLDKSLRDSMAPGANPAEKRVIGASKSVTLDPRMQVLYDYYVKTHGPIPVSDFINKNIIDHFKAQGIEPTLLFNQGDGKTTLLSPGSQEKSTDEIDKIMNDLRKQKLQKIQMKELENMTKETELELEQKRKEISGEKTEAKPEAKKDEPFSVDKMMEEDMKRAQYEHAMEQRNIQLERQRLENERRKAEIEKLKTEKVEKPKQQAPPFDPYAFNPFIYSPMQQSEDGQQQWQHPMQMGMNPYMMMNPYMQMQMQMMQMMQNQNKPQGMTADQMTQIIEAKLAKVREQDTLDKVRKDMVEREKEFREEMRKMSEQKQNMVLNELIRRQNELKEQYNGQDRLDMLVDMQQRFPKFFGHNPEAPFDMEKEKMHLNKDVIQRGLDMVDRVEQRMDKRMERGGRIVEKMVNASLDKQSGEWENYSPDDMEKMYKNLRKGNEDTLAAPTAQPPKEVRQLQQEPLEPEDFYSEQPEEDTPSIPQPPPQQQEPKKRENKYVSLTGSG